MPNWAYNSIHVATDEGFKKMVDLIVRDIEGEGKQVDFETLLPMPKPLNIEECSQNENAILCYLTEKFSKKLSDLDEEETKIVNALVQNVFWEQHNATKSWAQEVIDRSEGMDTDELYEKGKKLIHNYKTYYHTTWWGWCCNIWGTKWNACDTSIDEECRIIRFDTAWSAPLGFICALYNRLPDVDFDVEVYHEDCYGDAPIAFEREGKTIKGYRMKYPREGSKVFNEYKHKDLKALREELGYDEDDELKWYDILNIHSFEADAFSAIGNPKYWKEVFSVDMMHDLLPTKGANTNQWWVYDEDEDAYIDPPAEVLDKIEAFSGDTDEQEKYFNMLLSWNPNWLYDEDYIYHGDELDFDI